MLLLLACVKDPGGLVVVTTPELYATLADAVAFVGDDRLTLVEHDDPVKHAARYANSVAISLDATLCSECFEGTVDGSTLTVAAQGPLAAQYALATALEAQGYSFPHPMRSALPADSGDWSVWKTGVQGPEQRLRALDPHTLHPIEFMQDVWVPGEAQIDRVRRVVDWVIKNRGNHINYPGLDNILDSTAEREAWGDHTAAFVDYAHERGITVGIGVQLFGGANLQQAFDLLEDASGDEEVRRTEIRRRLDVLYTPAEGVLVPYDRVNLSFGEFSGEEPETFIENVNLFVDVLAEVAMDNDLTIEPSAAIHVGKNEDTLVEYQGEELLYYFLVKFADPSIVPWVHTTMYYNLFDDAGGAYQHDEFSEHREYLFERLDAGQPVAYFPESAYWCAFDNPIPLYFPVYIKSRYVDFFEIAATGRKLDEHVLFSSGWEWGYWQTDVLVLRMGWKLEPWEDMVRGQLTALSPGAQETVIALADEQYEAMIVQRLAPWMAGLDTFMDLGRNVGIYSQPPRPTFDEIVEMSVEDRAVFSATFVEPLRAHGDAMQTIADGFVPADTEWDDEVSDGLTITILRARWMTTVLDALLAHADGDAETAAALIETAEGIKVQAQAVVDDRHAALYDPEPARLLDPLENATLYPYGYLRHADNLCFWERDRAQLRNLVLGESVEDPGCALD